MPCRVVAFLSLGVRLNPEKECHAREWDRLAGLLLSYGGLAGSWKKAYLGMSMPSKAPFHIPTDPDPVS